jgi:hypothetical protein
MSNLANVLRASVGALTLAGAMAVATEAHAEGWLIDGEAGVGTGLEGGDDGSGEIAWQRARTRIIAGAELRSDEETDQGFAFRAFAEIERRGSIGAELRYARWPSERFGVFVGAIGTVTPETLVGGVLGARLLFPFDKKNSVFIEPSFAALPLGSDLPGDTPILWALFTVGVRLGL